ncbi:hypothetical protein ABZ651_12970, partial [Streptomyces sp. NPDC007070]
MNYCHPCRRHLNGALLCPGCGTPAEALPVVSVEPELPVFAEELEPIPVGGGDEDRASAPGRAERRRAQGRGRG